MWLLLPLDNSKNYKNHVSTEVTISSQSLLPLNLEVYLTINSEDFLPASCILYIHLYRLVFDVYKLTILLSERSIVKLTSP